MTSDSFDCLIIGGGPAGLTAAIYLARFRLKLLVLDDGHSRAALIPLTRNHAGFPEGISGAELLARMTRQARSYGAEIRQLHVGRLERDGNGFRARAGAISFAASTILLATGVVNRRPPMTDDLHADALARGLLRYCPICDGYEVTDQSVAVIGSGERGVKEAIFLRSYSDRISLISLSAAHELSEAQRRTLDAAGIVTLNGPAREFELGDGSISLSTSIGRLSFDTLYPALGSDVRSELAVAVGAKASQDGCLVVDAHQQCTVPGIFAAGDVVLGLDQISHAMGEGGVAATAIRNHLAETRDLYR